MVAAAATPSHPQEGPTSTPLGVSIQYDMTIENRKTAALQRQVTKPQFAYFCTFLYQDLRDLQIPVNPSWTRADPSRPGMIECFWHSSEIGGEHSISEVCASVANVIETGAYRIRGIVCMNTISLLDRREVVAAAAHALRDIQNELEDSHKRSHSRTESASSSQRKRIRASDETSQDKQPAPPPDRKHSKGKQVSSSSTKPPKPAPYPNMALKGSENRETSASSASTAVRTMAAPPVAKATSSSMNPPSASYPPAQQRVVPTSVPPLMQARERTAQRARHSNPPLPPTRTAETRHDAAAPSSSKTSPALGNTPRDDPKHAAAPAPRQPDGQRALTAAATVRGAVGPAAPGPCAQCGKLAQTVEEIARRLAALEASAGGDRVRAGTAGPRPVGAEKHSRHSSASVAGEYPRY